VEPFHVDQVKQALSGGLAELGLPTDPAALDRWTKLALLLDRWSQRINLTAHRSPLQIARRLLLEAAALHRVLPEAESIADLGSGAGIPGLPIAICRPRCQVWLVESRERRHHFQRAAVRDLGLDNVVPLLGRAEAIAIQSSAGVIAQAMAQPERALSWMIPWAMPGGWVAIATSPAAADRLHHPDLVPERVLRYSAPHGPDRAAWIARRTTRGPEP
jgi:16S rRNA (guanine527-N7)-methyltransferase